MCPACLTTAAWLVAGTGSAGGLAALTMKEWRRRHAVRDSERKAQRAIAAAPAPKCETTSNE